MALFKKFLKTFASCFPITKRRKEKTSSHVTADEDAPSPFARMYGDSDFFSADGDDLSYASTEDLDSKYFVYVPRLSPPITSCLEVLPPASPASVSADRADSTPGEISPSPTVSDTSAVSTEVTNSRQASLTDFSHILLSGIYSSRSVESLAPIPSEYASQISPSPSGQSLRLLLQLARPPRFSATDASPSPSVQSLVVHTSAGVSQSRSLECMHR